MRNLVATFALRTSGDPVLRAEGRKALHVEHSASTAKGKDHFDFMILLLLRPLDREANSIFVLIISPIRGREVQLTLVQYLWSPSGQDWGNTDCSSEDVE